MVTSHTGCGCMTSKTGCLIIGWLYVIPIILMIIGCVVAIGFGIIGGECPTTQVDVESAFKSTQFRNHEKCISPEMRQSLIVMGIVGLTGSALNLVAPCCLISGANKGKSSRLIPFIFVGALRNIMLVVLFILFLIIMPLLAIVPFIALAIEVYITVVVWCHYTYLKGKPEISNNSALHSKNWA